MSARSCVKKYTELFVIKILKIPSEGTVDETNIVVLHLMLIKSSTNHIVNYYMTLDLRICVQNCLARVVTFCATPDITSFPLAPCSISHRFQTLYYGLSNSFFWRTFVSIFHAFSYRPNPDHSIHLVFTWCLFPGLKLMLTLVTFQLLSLPDTGSVPFYQFQFQLIPFGQFQIKFINSNLIQIPFFTYYILPWWWWWSSSWLLVFYGHFCAHGRLNGPSDLWR